MLKLFSASLVALGLVSAVPAYADPIAGILRDTSNTSDWQVKVLGDGNWMTQLADPAIPYEGTYEFYSTSWVNDLPWINPYVDGNSPGSLYYSYKTTITDDFSSLGNKVVFDALSLKLAGDDQLYAIIINGNRYDGFDPVPLGEVSFGSYIQLSISSISWNVGAPNTIEVIVYDSGGVVTGLSGSFQASYSATAVPEPEIYAMLLAGFGVVGVAARRRKIKVK
ncbi:MAG: PEP-CTERM sorting domain-containing protein [Betaproteobacteria bacterium]|nr:PEP-CTERM sorting domain-containing protein [Betaproteobacteria bacterium]